MWVTHAEEDIITRVSIELLYAFHFEENTYSVVVFVHGAGISRTIWRPQTAALADTYRTIGFPRHGDRRDESFVYDDAVEAVESLWTT